jgi:hypothetical protein
MARKRKTIAVEDLKEAINASLELSTCSPPERRAMASVLEQVLHRTGNYRGFRYLESANGRREDGVWKCDDDSRRYYI